MRALDRKMLRDLRRLWAQALAVALVLACGVATLVLAVGAYRSLEDTRVAYYDRYRFGHLFASATRAPESLLQRVAAIDGVAAAEGRIVRPVLLDVPGLAEPASGTAISLPKRGVAAVNRLYLREGRLPESGADDEVAVNERFAAANDLRPGSSFAAILDGKKRNLTVTGTVLSPEYVYALGPGSLVPDDRRFGVLFLPHDVLAAAFDMQDAFDNLSLRLLRGADAAPVTASVDALLAPYGGTGAYGRKDQMSDAFLDSELNSLIAMARIIPPVFLLVSAYLINMILSRLIALEREQIGLLKALGYGAWTISAHYLKLVVAIALVGVAIGFAAGTWLGVGLTRLYGEFYNFPFLLFSRSVDTYVVAAAVAVGAAVVGALRAVRAAASLPPAVAMRPPEPPSFKRMTLSRMGLTRYMSQLTVMALRNMVRWPVRTGLAALGTSFAVALLVVALFTGDAVGFMVDTMFFRSDRQDATLAFSSARPPAARDAAARLPGVMRTEPYLVLPAVLRNGPVARRLAITGKPAHTELSRVLDLDLDPVGLPEAGLVLSERVARVLGVGRGDRLEVDFLTGRRRTVEARVAEVIQSYMGMAVFMEIDALAELSGSGPRLSGVYVSLDGARLADLYEAVKETPLISSINLAEVTLKQFRGTVEQNIAISNWVYVSLSVIIAFGVIYNSARIQLSERARELAGLRVLGFSRWEVSRVLLVELATVTLLAQPIGWALGFGLSWAVVQGFASDLFRVPFVVERATFATASLVVVTAAAVSALIVRRRVDRLDLIAVLKTRD